MELFSRLEKTVWQIDKHAQIEMGFIRKNRQLIFDLERKRSEVLSLHI